MGNKPDGAVVLKHARSYGFFDNHKLEHINAKTLEKMGINPFMTRQKIITCLQQIEINIQKPLMPSGMAIEKIIDFCANDHDTSEAVNSANDNKQKMTIKDKLYKLFKK